MAVSLNLGGSLIWCCYKKSLTIWGLEQGPRLLKTPISAMELKSGTTLEAPATSCRATHGEELMVPELVVQRLCEGWRLDINLSTCTIYLSLSR